MLEDRRALPKEVGHITREDKAMHEEHFVRKMLKEDTEK